uniref:Ig-like domain-containing protein n=1 Tax=Pseudonaja textilis TaxID=8673 RepID=A0A670Y439_PSETE
MSELDTHWVSYYSVLLSNFSSTLFQFIFASAVSVLISGTAEEDYVEIWPPNPVVKFGGSLDLNCTSTCENIGIESAYTKVPIENGSNWKAFRLSNVDYWAASPMCYADCKTGQKKSPKANIIVYKTPDHVKLDTVPKMEVGKQYNLTCRVSGVAPIWNLSVTLLKGEEQLLVKTFEDYSDPKTNDVVVNHLITALQHDHHKTVTCQTSLDLNPTGPLLKNTSHNITLESFDIPLLHAGLFLEAGTLMKVTCDAPEASPANEAVFDLRFAGKSLTFNTTVMGGLASAQAVIASSSVGDHELICTVSLGPVTKNVTKMVNVFGESHICILTQRVLEEFFSTYYKLTKCAAALQNKRRYVALSIITSEINHIFFSILDAPKMDDSSCPQTRTWKEGSTTTLTCTALGNPTPTVQCWKDGRLYDIGEPQRVQTEHGGIYHCNATNQYGFDVRDVTIHVEQLTFKGYAPKHF